ncbi:MAG: rhodanese-like domain-containing protein [Solirubrobacterales bacterium]|nr:rhodanese-like domain-containing protein [Solirubrobacterales bacterium]
MATNLDPDDVEVSPEQTAQALADDSAQVIDVREQYEWDAGHIDGTIHVELGRLSSAADKEISRDKPVIFVCRVGGRSGMAADAFRASGFEAHSMAGGVLLWDDQRRPLVPEGATVADH